VLSAAKSLIYRRLAQGKKGVGIHDVNVYPHRRKMRVAGIGFEPYRNAFNLIDEFLAN
jgi:hypothetical protein